MSEFDLDELNRQMNFFQNDYNTSPQGNINAVNFQSPIEQSIPNQPNITTQIKRPTKSGEHRNEINDKMSQMNLSMPIPPLQPNPNSQNTMMVHSRNNSVYTNANTPQQQGNVLSSKRVPNTSENKFSSYYNHNFDTLQNVNNTMQPTARNNNVVFNKSTNLNPVQIVHPVSQAHPGDTHEQGITFINVNNLLTGQNDNNSNRINDNGYHLIEEKKMDYRQNMNNKIDNFIFNNPYENNYVNPILLAARNNSNNNNGVHRDSRMVIQDSSKDFYRQEANSRLSQYSPLSRASNIPIDIANLSVNDFYSNQPNQPNISQQFQDDDQKALINSRMSQYAPLAKTIQYQTQQQQQQQQQQLQPQSNGVSNYETMIKYHQQQLQNYYNDHQNMQNNNEKPKHWQSLDVNPNLSNKQLPVYDQLPVISNKNY
jgi:hypothetical protein